MKAAPEDGYNFIGSQTFKKIPETVDGVMIVVEQPSLTVKTKKFGWTS